MHCWNQRNIFFVIQNKCYFLPFTYSIRGFNMYLNKTWVINSLKKMDSNIVKNSFIVICVLLLCFTILENISRTISVPDQLVHLVNYINNSVTNVSQKKRFYPFFGTTVKSGIKSANFFFQKLLIWVSKADLRWK